MINRKAAYYKATLLFREKIIEIRDMAGQLKALKKKGFIKAEHSAAVEEDTDRIIEQVLEITDLDPDVAFKKNNTLSPEEIAKLLAITYQLGKVNGALRELVVHGETLQALSKMTGAKP